MVFHNDVFSLRISEVTCLNRFQIMNSELLGTVSDPYPTLVIQKRYQETVRNKIG